MKYIIKSQKDNKRNYCYCDVDCNNCTTKCSAVCKSYDANSCPGHCGAVIAR